MEARCPRVFAGKSRTTETSRVRISPTNGQSIVRNLRECVRYDSRLSISPGHRPAVQLSSAIRMALSRSAIDEARVDFPDAIRPQNRCRTAFVKRIRLLLLDRGCQRLGHGVDSRLSASSVTRCPHPTSTRKTRSWAAPWRSQPPASPGCAPRPSPRRGPGRPGKAPSQGCRFRSPDPSRRRPGSR